MNFPAQFLAILTVFLSLHADGAQSQGFDPELLVAPLGSGQAGPVVQTMKSQNTLNIQPGQQIPPGLDFPSASLLVEFDGDSHLLTANGIKTLRSVAAALVDPRLANASFQVAGHMVSPNNQAGVQRSSALRAQTVVEHLVAYYQIPPHRLVPVGYGSNRLAVPQNIYDPNNTRIEFINMLR